MNKPSLEPIVSTLSFAGWAAILAACGLAAVSLAGADVILNAAAVPAPARALFSWMHVLVDLRPGDPRFIAALPEAAGSALAIGAGMLAFRRPIARSLASASAVGAHSPARAGRVEAAVAVCVFAVCVGLAARNLDLPIRYDEAKNITQFAAKPIWTILSDYGSRPTHILHNLLLRAAHEFLGTSPAALRAPAFLAACLTLPAVWWFVRREYGWLAAAFATALTGASPLFIEYATNARGYTLLALLFMVTLLCGQGLVRRPDDHVRWGLFAAAAALGFFTTPVMAFPVAIATVWMLLVRWREQGAAGIRPFAVNGALWCAAAVALTALLYVPVLIVSGVDALFFNDILQRSKLRHVAIPINLLPKWGRWHAATPVWAQTVLLLALVVGTMAPRLPSRHRGLLTLAVVSGTAAVLLAKPVWLMDRHTIFALLATTMVAGAGLAFLSEATFARFRPSAGVVGRWARGEGFGALAVVLVLGCFSWWATRPGVAEHFAWETGWSPNASALAAAVAGVVSPGDYVFMAFPTTRPVEFHLRRLGRDVRLVRAAPADEFGLSGTGFRGRRIVAFRVGEAGSHARFWLVVDEEGDRGAGPALRRRMHAYQPQFSVDVGHGHEMITNLPGAKVWRLRPPPVDPHGPGAPSMTSARHENRPLPQ